MPLTASTKFVSNEEGAFLAVHLLSRRAEGPEVWVRLRPLALQLGWFGWWDTDSDEDVEGSFRASASDAPRYCAAGRALRLVPRCTFTAFFSRLSVPQLAFCIYFSLVVFIFILFHLCPLASDPSHPPIALTTASAPPSPSPQFRPLALWRIPAHSIRVMVMTSYTRFLSFVWGIGAGTRIWRRGR
ncbi:hypothetical protein DFH08DRAFT_877617 [Mycena albidolilacea]|uniref:Uncharacterized protein n=1 Tax=Mycena albidolilacea TaxID=1033008 RepID=A0AAD6ZSJ1_9AGAR|nr:hypothetical protein DFH08DRAFT_877617 [Mycena albidolilacea]